MSVVIHFNKLDPHTLAIYKWEARCADRCFAWKFSKMHSLGMPAVHTEEGKVLGPSEAWGGLPVKKKRQRHKISQLQQSLGRGAGREGENGIGSASSGLPPSAPFTTPQTVQRDCTGHSHRTSYSPVLSDRLAFSHYSLVWGTSTDYTID